MRGLTLDRLTTDGADFFMMELIRGPSLQGELEAKGPLPNKAMVPAFQARDGSSRSGRKLVPSRPCGGSRRQAGPRKLARGAAEAAERRTL
jgi:hypothetical protein